MDTWEQPSSNHTQNPSNSIPSYSYTNTSDEVQRGILCPIPCTSINPGYDQNLETLRTIAGAPLYNGSNLEMQLLHVPGAPLYNGSNSEMQISHVSGAPLYNGSNSDMQISHVLSGVPMYNESNLEMQISHVLGAPMNHGSNSGMQISHVPSGAPMYDRSNLEMQISHVSGAPLYHESNSEIQISQVSDAPLYHESNSEIQISQVSDAPLYHESNSEMQISQVSGAPLYHESNSEMQIQHISGAPLYHKSNSEMQISQASGAHLYHESNAEMQISRVPFGMSRGHGDPLEIPQVPNNMSRTIDNVQYDHQYDNIGVHHDQLCDKTQCSLVNYVSELFPCQPMYKEPENQVITSPSSSSGTVIENGENSVATKKSSQWTEDEHKLFLLGLRKYKKGDWKSISRYFVTTRSSIQVASHAQKFFIRKESVKEKKRSSIHDIVDVDDDDIVDLFNKGLLSPVDASELRNLNHPPQTHTE